MLADMRTFPLQSVGVYGLAAEYLERLVSNSLPSIYELLEKTGRVDNFRIPGGKRAGSFTGFQFNDSDVYKWAEATSYVLAQKESLELKQQYDRVIQELAEAQDENGYLDTFFPITKESERWSDLAWAHELYCAGHLIQAGIAHKRATGKESLFLVAKKFADHIVSVFGTGRKEGTGGHPEIEMALVELFRETGSKNYLDLARYFIEARGKGLASVTHYPGPKYFVDHKPFLDLEEMTGHAVRMLYLCCRATDVFLQTDDTRLWDTLNRLWENLTTRKMYITGACGSRIEWEAFGDDYDLPNQKAYAETCASIANFMWNHKMLLASGDGKYADVMEQVFYNGLLAGILQDGMRFFYVNSLESDGQHSRKEWFDCSCCPPNIARLIASFAAYMYTTSEEGLWVHLYERSKVDLSLTGRKLTMALETDYPWSPHIRLVLGDIEPPNSYFAIFLRIPSWSKDFSLNVNGETVSTQPARGYVKVNRSWNMGDTVELSFSMEIELVRSHPSVETDRWKVAVIRGAVVFCAEHVDNPDFDVRTLYLKGERQLSVDNKDVKQLGKTITVEGEGIVRDVSSWEGILYLSSRELRETEFRVVAFRLVPYFVWANREEGPMVVWMGDLS